MTDIDGHEEIFVTLARIEEKLDRALIDVQDHEHRLRGIERWRYAFSGVATILGTGGGALLGKLVGQ